MSKDMKESTPFQSCNDEHHNETSLELTPEVIAHERQLQLERETIPDQQQDQSNRNQKDKDYCHAATARFDEGGEEKVEVKQENKNDYTITTKTSCPQKQSMVNATNASDGIDILGYEDGDSSFELTPDNIANERLKQTQREIIVSPCHRRQNFLTNFSGKKAEERNMHREIDPAPVTTASLNLKRRQVDSSVQENTIPGAFAIRGMNAREEEEEIYDSTLDSIPFSNSKMIVAENVDEEELAAKYSGIAKEKVRERMQKEAIKASIISGRFENNDKDYRWKLGLFASAFIILVTIAVVTGVVVMSRKEEQEMAKNTFGPTTSPTLSNFINLQEQMKSISGDTVFDDSSPQYKALSWLTFEDPFVFGVETKRDYDDEFLDRYILAVVYFSTGGPNWLNDLNFLTNSSVCDWNDHYSKFEGGNNFGRENELFNGVHCDNRGVTKIHLDRNNLNGTIPFEVGTILIDIDDISIADNDLYGTIPSSLGNLFRLEFLDVSSNAINGTIPTSFTHLTRLQYFSTKYNHLKGPIPSAITNLVSLERLDLSFNQLTGSIPEFSLQNSFEYLLIDNNLVDGPLPESLVQLSNLAVINLSNNVLTGTLPSRLGMLENLSILILFENEINGSLPLSIGNLEVLTTLAVDLNFLTGSIPNEIGKLTKLKQLYLDHNNISGTVPTDLGQCTNIHALYLDNNPELRGTIPLTFSNMYGLEQFHIHGTSITGSLDTLVCAIQPHASADCGGISPNVNCTCCVECCDPLSGICKEEKDKKCVILEYHIALFGHTAECTCGSDLPFTCSFADCPTCNEDNTICGTRKEIGWNQPLSHFSTTYHNIFQYHVGRNETIMWDEIPEVDCNVSINGQQCNECSVYYCRDGFPARYIDCTNIVDVVDGGIYDTCQHYKTGGVFEYISWWDKFSWTGCIPFLYRPLQ